MDDLISREALLDAYDKAHQCPPGGARKLIEEAQDALVRCKDCKKYMTIHCTCDGCCISPDWFCADGERKSADEILRRKEK